MSGIPDPVPPPEASRLRETRPKPPLTIAAVAIGSVQPILCEMRPTLLSSAGLIAHFAFCPIRYPAVNVLNYTASRQRLTWLGYLSLIAAIPLVHFAISVGIWLMWWGATLRNPWLRPRFFEEFFREFLCFAPALCLFILSAAAFGLALKRRRAAWRVLLVIALSAVTFFWTDVHFQRYQVSVDIATKEYWDHGGMARRYFTWWWYNDLWFR